jgi:hypothetical protein
MIDQRIDKIQKNEKKSEKKERGRNKKECR